MTKQRVLASVVLVCLSFLGHAGGATLSGLSLGMTIDQAQAVVPSMTKVSDERNFSIYTADVLPLRHPTVEAYRLIFSNGKLVRLRSLSENITNDVYGTEGKSKYAALQATLIRKYGEPTHEVLSTGNKGFKDPEEFWVCLSFPVCGEWVSQFKTSEKVISIRMEGSGAAGKGQIEVVEESVPEFSEAIELYRLIGTVIAALLGGAGGGVVALIWTGLVIHKRKMGTVKLGQTA